MTEEREYIDDLLISMLTGDIDAKGLAELSAWSKASLENERYVRQRQEIWLSATDHDTLSKYDSEAAFSRFQQRVAERRTDAVSTGRSKILPWLWRVAAVALLAVLSVVIYQFGQRSNAPTFADIRLEVPMGSRVQTTLPDGSKVWLNAGSRMVCSQGFGISNRELSMDGEAYFEVVRNEELPFTVTSDNVEVRVLGTKFNVRDYASDAATIVTLAEGAVNLKNRHHAAAGEVTLKPGCQAIVDKQSGKITTEYCEPKNVTAWIQGNLIFDGKTLRQIAGDLERSYNVSITLGSPDIDSLRFYGDFLRQEQTLSEVLDALSATGRLTYTMNNKEVTITKQ